MSHKRFIVIGVAIAALIVATSLTALSQGQGLITQKAISLDMAQAMVQGAIQK
jgi:hypothetical protein